LDDGPAAVEVCLIHRPRYDDWSFPKGKLKSNESFSHAAVREVEEETGIPIRLLSPLGKVSYRLHTDGSEGRRTKHAKAGKTKSAVVLRKRVAYWAAEQLDESASAARQAAFGSPILPTPDEADNALWLPIPQAREKLTYRSDKKMLEAFVSLLSSTPLTPTAIAPTAPPCGTLILLRHAKAEERKHWEGTELDRPLTPRGAQDAYAITRELACFAPTTLISSPWLRCVETIEPYALLSHQEIELDDRLSEEAFAHAPLLSIEAVINCLTQVAKARTTAVICMHRPVLGAVFDALEGFTPVAPREAEEAEETPDGLSHKFPHESPFLPTACALALTITLDEHTQKPVITHIQRLHPVVY
jgi:8-oxo-dGTP diphosphatase